ncbi:MAG: hypothetical protein ACYTKD_06205 [Planctomycetota bacterium]|jgi:tetratricopeptide (TPR) repeat protein
MLDTELGARWRAGAAAVALVCALAGPALPAEPLDDKDEIETIIIKRDPIRCRILRWDAAGVWIVPVVADVEIGPMRVSWDDVSRPDKERICARGKRPSAVDRVLRQGGGGLVEAVRIRLKNGTVFVCVEVEGRSTDEELVVRTRNIPEARYRRADIVSIETVMLPRTAFFSLEEIYLGWLEERSPRTAREHVALAEELMELGHWARAIEHYERANVLDPDFAASTVPRIAEARAKMVAGLVKEIDRRIRVDVRARRWWSALRRINQLARLAPDSTTRTEWDAKREEIIKNLRAELRRMVVLSYYLKMTELVRKRAWGLVSDGEMPGVVVTTSSRGAFRGLLVSDDEEFVVIRTAQGTISIERDLVTSIRPVDLNTRRRRAALKECRDYVTDTSGGIAADILRGLELEFRKYSTRDEPITQQLIKEYWDGRLASKTTVMPRETVRTDAVYAIHEADYGTGTWLRQGQGRGSPGRRPRARTDPEKWWRSQTYEVRIRVLQAFAAEALCKVTAVRKRGCGGKGVRPRIGVASARAAAAQTCSACRGLGYAVKVTYR